MLRSETAANPERMARALAGLRRYQDAERTPPPAPMPAVAEAHGAMLRNYTTTGSGPPILFVPSLINPPNILDLGAGRSLLRWLAGRGHRVLLVDWGWDVRRRSGISVAGHVEEILLPLIEALGEPPSLAGYCLGGTMAVAAALIAPVRALATIAAPWHFAGFSEVSRLALAGLWGSSAPTAAALGLLPMEMLQSAFWSLDPARTVAKFEEFATMEPGSKEAETFVTLEDWANDGPPIGEAAAREMFEDFLARDTPGTGAWKVGGRVVDPKALSCPLLNIASTTDRIVPHASALREGMRIDLDLGHVGMVIGGRAPACMWEPLETFLARG